MQIIARLGRWVRNSMNSSYLKFFRPEGLLAAAGWPEGAHGKFDRFWSERMLVEVGWLRHDARWGRGNCTGVHQLSKTHCLP